MFSSHSLLHRYPDLTYPSFLPLIPSPSHLSCFKWKIQISGHNLHLEITKPSFPPLSISTWPDFVPFPSPNCCLRICKRKTQISGHNLRFPPQYLSLSPNCCLRICKRKTQISGHNLRFPPQYLSLSPNLPLFAEVVFRRNITWHITFGQLSCGELSFGRLTWRQKNSTPFCQLLLFIYF